MTTLSLVEASSASCGKGFRGPKIVVQIITEYSALTLSLSLNILESRENLPLLAMRTPTVYSGEPRRSPENGENRNDVTFIFASQCGHGDSNLS